jgi:MFS family permease
MPYATALERSQTARLPWLVVGAGFTLGALGISVRQLLGLAMPQIEAELGASRTLISASALLALLLLGFGGLYAGVMLNRLGRARLLGLGLALVGTGAAASGFIDHPAVLVVTFGLIAGAGFGLAAPAVLSTLVAPYFSTRRGLALGITAAGSTLGPVLAIPLAALAFDRYGWRTGFVIAGLVCLAAVPAIVATLRRVGPPPGAESAAAPALGQDFRRLWTSPVFHLLFWGYAICGFTTFGVIETHFIPYAALCGFAPTTAANAFGVLSFFNLLGVLLAGWLSDRVNRPLLLAAVYGLRALSFVLLMNVGADPSLLFLFAILFGLFDYATVPIVASLVASHLGLRVMGLAIGLIALGHQVGSAIGALGGGIVFDLFNSYAGLWTMSLVLALAAGAMSVGIRTRSAAATA